MTKAKKVPHLATILLVALLWLAAGCDNEKPGAQLSGSKHDHKKVAAKIISIHPKDGARVTSLESPIYVNFDLPPDPGQLTFKISPDQGKWEIDWASRGRQAILRPIKPFVAGRKYSLVVGLGTPESERRVSFTAFGPSSLELIDQAQKQGRITADRAWTCRLQRIFEPHRLPKEFASPTAVHDADAVVRNYFKARAELSPNTAKALDRYLKRPVDQASFYHKAYRQASPKDSLLRIGPQNALAGDSDQRPDYLFSIDCAKAPIRVWAPKKYKQKAINAKNMIDTHDMYNRFKSLLGRPALDDLKDHPNGGDGRIDFYLVPPPGSQDWAGLCIPAVGYRQWKSAYVFIDWNLDGDWLAAVLAHELFHVFQFSFDYYEDNWWMEATANWAEDYIEETWDYEWEFLERVFRPSHNEMVPIDDVGNEHEYGICLFPFYMAQEYDAQVIAQIWKNCEKRSSLDAIDQALGFDDTFKEFAMFNLDDGKYAAKYKDHGSPLELFDYHDYKQIEIDPDKPEVLKEGIYETIYIPPLGAVYVRVINYLDKDKTPQVKFKLKHFAENPDLAIQALIDPGVKDRYQDWTGSDERVFCLNRDSEYFDGIALVLTNKNRKELFDPQVIIKVDSGGCSEKRAYATVTSSMNQQVHTFWEHQWPNGNIDRDQQQSSSQISATVRMTLVLENSSIAKSTNSIDETYKVLDADIQSLTLSSNYKSTTYYYDKEQDCATEIVTRKNSLPPRQPKLEHSGSLSIVYDLESGRAKWVSLPALNIVFNGRERSKETTSGCGHRDPENWDLEIKSVIFPLGPVHVISSEQLEAKAKPEIQQFAQIARQMQSLAQKAPSMSYKQMEKMMEDFEKQHDTDKLSRSLEAKLISPDLKASSGDGEGNIKGGGSKSETKQIPHGTRSVSRDFRWEIHVVGNNQP